MKLAHFCAFAMLGVCSLAYGAPSELDAIQGVWTVRTATLGGQVLPGKLTAKWRLTIKKDRFVFDDGSGKEEGVLVPTPGKHPQEMTIKSEKGPNAGKPIPTIYYLSKQGLQISYGLNGSKPKDFKSAKGTQQFVVLYMRS